MIDDMVTGGSTIEQAFKIYCTAKRVMSEGGFNLQKWSSNSEELMRRIQIAESLITENPPSSTESSSPVAMRDER